MNADVFEGDAEIVVSPSLTSTWSRDATPMFSLLPEVLSPVKLGVNAKWERLPCPRLNVWFAAVCLRNASKSGLASTGICFGVWALKDRIEEVGGLQLSLGPMPESLG